MINLLYAGNDKTFDGILISLLSIVKHYKGALNVFILSMDLTFENEDYKMFSEPHRAAVAEKLCSVNNKSRVHVIDVRENYLKTLHGGKNCDSKYTPYAFIRLLSYLYEQIPDKVLYLDYDAVAIKSIENLWNIDISDYDFAGVKDYYGRFFISPRYLNSGVLLINMEKVRKNRTFEKSILLVKNKKMLLPDQTALNKCATKKLILPAKYNEQHKIEKDTVIRHFSMTIKFFPKFKTQNIKPWDIEKLHTVLRVYELDDVLVEYLKIKNQLKNDL